jgi:hydrophobe/amphiphile efflux-3 (HAE3) family protein
MAHFIYKYRFFIMAICILIGAGSLFIIPKIKVDPDIRNYIPESIDSRVQTDRIESEFGTQDMVMILFSDSCILDPDNLRRIKDTDRGISKLGGVSSRISPFTVRRISSEEGMMVVNPLIGEIPSDKEQIQKLGEDIFANDFARDIVISSDLTTASVTATVNRTVEENETTDRIDSIVKALPGKAEVMKGGLPYIRKSILRDVRNDAIILIPAALLIMLMVLRLNLGNWRSVFIPFSIVFLTTVFSMALVPLFGWKMSIITVLVPVILIGVANNYGIYIVARFQELKLNNPDIPVNELLKILIKSLIMPILFSGLTTVAGILGLIAHSIIPAKQVGVLAASGVTLALLMSLLLIPSLIAITSAGLISRSRKRNVTSLFDSILGKLSGLVIRHPGRILGISGSVILLFAAGIMLIRIDTNMENYFSSDHPIKKASEIINEKFGGSQTISVMIEGDISDPILMQGIDRLTNEVKVLEGVGNVFSISQFIREMSRSIFIKGEDGYNSIPDSREAIAQMFELYSMSGDPEDFRQLIDMEYSKAHLLIRFSNPDKKYVRPVSYRIKELTSGMKATVSIGGYALIMADFAESIIKGQISSLVFAVITVFLLLTMIFRSFRGGMTGSIPLIASIIILFGFMGYSGIPLDAATALLSSIMIGVGVDFTIQYIWNFNLQINSGLSWPEATRTAIYTIGRSIIINALSVMAGFGALIFSGFTSIRFFGYLVLISIGSCLIGALLIIPAFLLKYKPAFIGFNSKKTTNNDKNENDSNIIELANVFSDGGSAAARSG